MEKETNNSNAISKFSAIFVTRWRISVLLLVAVISIGVFTYTSILKKEGMPQIASPYGLITTPYFIDDADIVEEKITSPIETAIAEIPEVVKTYSSTNPNYSAIQMQFQQGMTSAEGMALVEEKVKSLNTLPENAVPEYKTFDFGKIDNEHDILFTLTTSTEKDYLELQEKGEFIAEELEKNKDIKNADIAQVISEEKNPVTGETIQNQSIISRFGQVVDGKLKFTNALYIGVSKKDNDIGAPEFSDIVKKDVENILKADAFNGYSATFSIGDPAIELEEQIDALQGNATEALIIVLFVIFFVINWRASLVTVVFIPTVLAATFIGFQFIGYSINNLTLFGLVLVLGLFVDDAIVVVEAIDAQKQKGLKGLNAIKRAVKKVGLADITGTVTTMFVFIPMAMISGVLGEFIRPVPVTVILALAISLVIALSLIPFMSSVIIKDRDDKKEKVNIFTKIDDVLHKGGVMFNTLGTYVGKFVDFYLRKPILFAVIYLGSIALIFVGLFVASTVPFEIFPAPKDANVMSITVSFSDGTTIKQAESLIKNVETLLTDRYTNEIRYVNYFQSNERSALLYLELTKMSDRKDSASDIVDDLNETFKTYTTFSAKAATQSVGGGSGDYQYQMQVYSENPETLLSASTSITNFIKDIKISDDVKIEDAVIEDTRDILRIDGRRYFQIKAKLSETENISGDLATLTNKIKENYSQAELTKLGLNEDALGYDLGFESEMNESMNSLYLGMMIILIVMYALLVLEFNSFTKPFLVFLGIPFAAPLLFAGLKMTDNKISFFVILGITALMGIVANNSIMLLDFAQTRAKEEGKGTRDAIVGAIKRRFRPLVATSVITITGLLPLALNDPFWAPLALSIIFGLLSSTTLVILAFPAHYYAQEKITSKFTKLVKKIL